MVSELVTDALLHGIGTIRLRVDVDPGGLRVEVSDQGEVALGPSPTPARRIGTAHDHRGVGERRTR